MCLGGRGNEHGSFEKRLSLPWKTELFKNILPVSSEDITTKYFFGQNKKRRRVNRANPQSFFS